MIAYASRTGTRRNVEALRLHGWRMLVSAAACGGTIPAGFSWALDNGAWSYHQQGRPFDAPAFAKALGRWGAGADWTVVPDVVAGGAASLELSLRWLRRVLDACPRALLAVQNGISPDDVRPFLGDRVGLFVGGDTVWKLATLPTWGALGREVGCWVHVGRVNSAKRIHACALAGADSFDGTSVSRFAVTAQELEHARQQLPLWRVAP